MIGNSPETFSRMYHPIEADKQTPQRISPGELHTNREAYKGQMVVIEGILRRTTYQMGEDNNSSVHASEFVVGSGWNQFYVVIDPRDLSIMPISEPLRRDKWKELEGKQVRLTIAVREVRGILGGLARIRNAFTSDEHKVSCIPQIIKLEEVQSS